MPEVIDEVPKLADFPDEFQRAYKGLLPSTLAKIPEHGGRRHKALGTAIDRLSLAVQQLPDKGKRETAMILLNAFDERNSVRCFMVGYYSQLIVRYIGEILEKEEAA